MSENVIVCLLLSNPQLDTCADSDCCRLTDNAVVSLLRKGEEICSIISLGC